MLNPPRDRPIACAPSFFGAGVLLVSPHDGGVDHHVFVIVIARQQLENTLENTALRPSVESLIDNVPIAKAPRQISPGNTSSKSEENGERNLVERFFNKLKHFRAIVTRYDELAKPFLAGVQLASATILLN